MPSAINNGHLDRPSVKRQKLNSLEISQNTIGESRIFAPFRTIGLVSSTEVPFTSVPLGRSSFQITTSVGPCLQTYDLRRGLNLVFLTRPLTPAPITASLACKDRVFAAWGITGEPSGSGFWVFRRGKKAEELSIPTDLNERITQILIVGNWILGCCLTRIEIWRSTTYEHYSTLYTTAARKGGNEITGGISNIPTYINKILVGRRDGKVELWNVHSAKLIYTIQPPTADSGSVAALQPTPALSLVAIAYSEGALIIHDIKLDKSIISLDGRLSGGFISTISFRTDGLGAGADGTKPGVMATAGTQSGDVTFWDLNGGGRVMGVLRGAHNPPLAEDATAGGGISKIEFLPNQPLIVTGGLDNSLKSWIFDETPFSPVPRTLHSRSGHSAPATRLQFLPTDADGVDAGGKWLLSAAKDRSLWAWSLRRDGQSTEISQGHIRKKAKKLGILGGISLANGASTTLEDLKAPEITCMAVSLNRDGGMGAHSGSRAIWQKSNQHAKKGNDALASGVTGWESVVTGHRDDTYARTWFWGRKRAGRWALATGDGAKVSTVAISPCGTFAVVGSASGGIDMFNMQSGQHRQRYPPKLTPAQARKLKLKIDEDPPQAQPRFQRGLGKHTKAVTGLAVDCMNRHLISCSLDGKVKFWEFSSGNLVGEIDWKSMATITSLRYHAPSDIIALTCSDCAIRIVDIETRKTIRELRGCKHDITDCCISNDGRWVIAASNDSIVRVWDLPTGHLIDAIRMKSPCTALAFAGTGEFLATTCEGQLGVDIWTNKTLFTHVPTRQISEQEVVTMIGPSASGEHGHNLIEGAFAEVSEDVEDIVPSAPIDQLHEDMMTLSLVPKSRWQTLLHLDLIKQRNKPKEAPRVPEKAPFFLPSLESSKPRDNTTTAEETGVESIAQRSRIMKIDRIASESPFTTLLRSSSERDDYAPFLNYLSGLPPSSADIEIRSLQPSPTASDNELHNFVAALTSRLNQRRDYELVQTWMSVFLRTHGDSVAGDEGLRERLREWKETQEQEGRRLGELVGWCGGVVGFLRGPR